MDANDKLEGGDTIMDCKLANNRLENNFLVTDLTVQPLVDNVEMDTSPMENLSEGNRNKKKRLKTNKKKKAAIKDGVETMDQTTMYTRSTQGLLETDKMVQPVADNLKMDAENLSNGNANQEKKGSPRRNDEKEATVKDEMQSMDRTITDTRVMGNGLKTDLIEKQLADDLKLDGDSTGNHSEGTANKKKRKRNKKKEAASKDGVESMDQTTIYTRAMQGLLEADLMVQPVADNLKMDAENLSNGNANKEKKGSPRRSDEKEATVKDEMQSIYQTITDTRVMGNGLETDLNEKQLADDLKLDGDSTGNHSEGTANKKKRKRNKKKMAASKDGVESMDQTTIYTRAMQGLLEADLMVQPVADNLKMDAENLSNGNANKEKKGSPRRNEEKEATVKDEMQNMDQTITDTRIMGNGLETDLTEKQLADNLKLDGDLTGNLSEGSANKKKRKRNKKKKAAIKDGVETMDQTTIYTRSTQGLLETDLMVQPVADNLKMDAENLSNGNANKEKKGSPRRNEEKEATVKDEMQSMDQTITDTRVMGNVLETDLTEKQLADNLKLDGDSTGNFSEGSANKKKRKRSKKKKAVIKDDVQSMDQTPMDKRSTRSLLDSDLAMQPQADNPTIHAGSTENLSEGNVNKKKKKRPKRNKKNATIVDVVQSIDQITMDSRSKENLLETDLTVQPLVDNMKADAGLIGDLSEGNVNKKKKRRLKRNKKKMAKITDEVQAVGQTTVETGSRENLFETDVSLQPLTDSLKAEAGSIEDHAAEDEIQTMDKTTVDKGSIESPGEGNVIGKRKRKKKSNKAQIISAIQSVDQTKSDKVLTENLAEGKVTSKRYKCTNDMNNSSVSLSYLTHEPLDLCKHEENVLLPNVVEGSCYRTSSGLAQERFEPLARPTEFEVKFIPSESPHITHPSVMTEVDNEIILHQGKGSAEGRSSFSACNVEGSTHCSSCDLKHADCLYPKKAPIISIRRKLLVLDVNGLLADILQPPPKHCRGDIHMFGRAIFRRPFCDEFLKFCFQNFDVAIWSSRGRTILGSVVDHLLGGLKHKLLFCWDRSYCTQTGFKTLENKNKPLVCKELRKIWDNDDPNFPWKKGDYNESNTLLLDDSPYKALLNPMHTAIFPHSYSYMDKNDNSLGPGGGLRVYLEGLATSENVQKYVEQHPFGQGHIDEKSFSWGFYAGVLQSMQEKRTHHFRPKKKRKFCHSTPKLISKDLRSPLA